jgi:hypothetical protein
MMTIARSITKSRGRARPIQNIISQIPVFCSYYRIGDRIESPSPIILNVHCPIPSRVPPLTPRRPPRAMQVSGEVQRDVRKEARAA